MYAPGGRLLSKPERIEAKEAFEQWQGQGRYWECNTPQGSDGHTPTNDVSLLMTHVSVRPVPFTEFRDWFFHFTKYLEYLRAVVVPMEQQVAEEEVVERAIENVVNTGMSEKSLVVESLTLPPIVSPSLAVRRDGSNLLQQLLQQHEQDSQDENENDEEKEDEEASVPICTTSRSGTSLPNSTF